MHFNALALASVTAVFTGAHGTPVSVTHQSRRDVSSPGFTKCLQEVIPGWPYTGTPTSDQVSTCINNNFGITGGGDMAALNLDNDEVLYYDSEDDEMPYGLAFTNDTHTLKARDFIDNIFTVGKTLFLDRKANCKYQQVHDEFIWWKDIFERIPDVCFTLKEQIESNGLDRDGGVASVINKITNGHDKQGHQLKDKVSLGVSYLVNWFPPARMTINEIKAVASGVSSLCEGAIRRIGNVDDGGCKNDIRYYRPSKAKTFTDAAAIAGTLGVEWAGQKVADIVVDFFDDS